MINPTVIISVQSIEEYGFQLLFGVSNRLGDRLGNRVRRLMDGATLEPGVTDRFEATL